MGNRQGVQNLLVTPMPVILRAACGTECFRPPATSAVYSAVSCRRGGRDAEAGPLADEGAESIILTAIQPPGESGSRAPGPRLVPNWSEDGDRFQLSL